MYPTQLNGRAPDVIIHAFGSNDSHLGSGNVQSDEKTRIRLLFEQGVERLNRFVRTVFASHSCPTPIIIHLDDYFSGHGQGALLGDFTYRRVLQGVSSWYGNLAISSAQVMGPLVYADPLTETSFSPAWYMKSRGKQAGRFNENCHFPYLGHQVVSLSMAYSFLQSAVRFCEHFTTKEVVQRKSDELGQKRKSHLLPQVEQLLDILPPPLNFNTSLETIGTEWWAERDRQEEHCRTASRDQPCVMAWTAGPEVRW